MMSEHKNPDPTFEEWLAKQGACGEARIWLEQGGYYADPNKAWQECTRSDWMWWLLVELHTSQNVVPQCTEYFHVTLPRTETECEHCGAYLWTADDIREWFPDFPF